MSNESGPEFEVRALEIARAIYDPLGLQGSTNHGGRERDAIFIGEDSIQVFEFTSRRDKAKAQMDAEKLRQLIKELSREPGNRYKSIRGWFVTRDEPTADQRGVVEAEARKFQVPLNAISIATLKKRVCDADGYLRCRDVAPFGSASYTPREFPMAGEVEPKFRAVDSESTLNVPAMCRNLSGGRRVLLSGEFGVGKSYALRRLYRELRSNYVKSATKDLFPIHINLRDCVGLRTSAEILRRHSEEIGFSGDRGLISAWRSGACVLLLDGFDEVAPARWMGGVSDLKSVRWQALAAIRSLIQEAPPRTGIMICGRSHYFSSESEMFHTLGLDETTQHFRIEDFTEEQLKSYFATLEGRFSIPDWVPNRPLLLSYLYSLGVLEPGSLYAAKTPAESWRLMLSAICEREARMYTAVRPEVIRQIIARVATLARSRGGDLGPVEMSDMERAFLEVNNYKPDEEGVQLLLRLPGLTLPEGSEKDDSRVFVDRAIAATAYGEDLAAYAIDYRNERHPLANPASWVTAASELAVEVAAHLLAEQGIARRALLAAIQSRESSNWLDAVIFDLIRVVDDMFPDEEYSIGYMIDGVLIENLSLEGGSLMEKTTFRECLIHYLDLTSVSDSDSCPAFDSCMVGFLEGFASVPDWLESKFLPTTTVDEFSANSQTTAGILRMAVDPEIAVALTVLKKVYSQAGSGRKEESLFRGLDQARQQLVPKVIEDLLSMGLLDKTSAGRNTLYLPVKGKGAEARQYLNAPSTFKLN